MDTFAARLETLEHQWMRAWMRGDRKLMKEVAARDFVFLLGGSKATILDRASWLEAATTRLRCHSYRLGDIYARRHGNAGFFACQMEIEASIGDHDWNGTVWVSDIWRKSRMRQSWKLVERVVSRPESDDALGRELATYQLWH
ncbi:nuclear transport factor 2 family protein [Aurantiacibacter poecillastricola]|uniref:nuclear transport factor 2 family protein n=1 Tax=Aurantiacibacter poecillastricola TaxID=3064385 RepID=UPI00273FA797|nr:nuclear transport factor 2 family protein [Aurantiacibacter sp. 219JJ12-13]MDP5262139.1 nuclear transport factor 2 family protein [Aurantiacibacter sp. 219JJ12-13]